MKSQKSKVKSQNSKSKFKTDLRERCYYLSLKVIKLIETIDTRRVYLSILDQLLRSATSIGANIIEAKAASSKRDFINFYQIALKSANETKYWLCLIRDGLGFTNEVVRFVMKEVDEIANIIAASLLTMKNKR